MRHSRRMSSEVLSRIRSYDVGLRSTEEAGPKPRLVRATSSTREGRKRKDPADHRRPLPHHVCQLVMPHCICQRMKEVSGYRPKLAMQTVEKLGNRWHQNMAFANFPMHQRAISCIHPTSQDNSRQKALEYERLVTV
jgi:hypothetical protein